MPTAAEVDEWIANSGHHISTCQHSKLTDAFKNPAWKAAFHAAQTSHETGVLLNQIGFKNHFTKELDDKLADPALTIGAMRIHFCGKPGDVSIAAEKGSCVSIDVDGKLTEVLEDAGIADLGKLNIQGEHCCVETRDGIGGSFPTCVARKVVPELCAVALKHVELVAAAGKKVAVICHYKDALPRVRMYFNTHMSDTAAAALVGGADNRVLESEHPSNISKQLLGAVNEISIKTAGLILAKLVAADAAAHQILTACDEVPSSYDVHQTKMAVLECIGVGGTLARSIVDGVDDSTDLNALAADLFVYRSMKGKAAWGRRLEEVYGGDAEGVRSYMGEVFERHTWRRHGTAHAGMSSLR